MPSVVGTTWNMRVTWSFGPLAGVELNVSDPTFNADGTWNDLPNNHRGRWLQVGHLVVWNSIAPQPINVVYSGNIHSGIHAADVSMTGIMAQWIDGGNHGTFSAGLFLTDPEAKASVGVLAHSDPLPDPPFDPLLGPVASP